MVVSLLAESPQRVEAVALLDEVPRPANIFRLPRILSELTHIERYVLRCVAVHQWNHWGNIPYYPATAHQLRVACSLAGPSLHLLVLVGRRCPCFRLSRLGEAAARRVLHLVPAQADWAREREFDQMRALMRNKWEIGNDEEE